MGTRTITIALDYLAAGVHADAQQFGEQLAAHLGGSVQLSRPRNGYAFGYAVEVQDAVQAEFHVRPGEPIWTFATGSKSQALWDFLTEKGYDWYVTRHDAALDCFDPEWFPLLVETAKRWATANGMSTGVAGDWLNPIRGRTFYLGARSSRFFHRIYEKGRKERSDPAWIRCELEHKPQLYGDRLAARRLTAPQLWAMHAGPIFGSTLGVDLGQVFEMTADRTIRPARDQERARRALASQYGKTLERWLHDCADDPVHFVAELLTAVDHQARVRQWGPAPVTESPELSP